MKIKTVIKAALALSPAFLVRVARSGHRDATRRLRMAYQVIDPFGPVKPHHELRLSADACHPPVSQIADAFCVGRGLEIGPGDTPYCDPARTEFLDKYGDRYRSPYKIDVVGDADRIPRPDCEYDFVFSSHCLEHMPDTIRTLEEWKRVLKHGGFLVLILPHGETTFDQGRPLTTLEHHLKDYEDKVGTYDFTNWDDFEEHSIKQYDHVWLQDAASRRPDGTIDRDWVVEQGHMHYHVWTQTEIVRVLIHIDMKILYAVDRCEDPQNSFAVVAQK